MDRNKLLFAAALAVGVFLAAPAAHGTILVPGQSGVAPDLFAFLPGATEVGSVSGTFTSNNFTGHYIEEVFADPANGFGANDLTWLIQVTNNGPESILRITASSFAGFMTDVGANDLGIIPPGFMGGALPDPDTVDRDVTGAIIGFDYPFGLEAGPQPSSMLEIQTNATAFGAGFLSLSGGTINIGAATVAGLAPTAAVPELATWAMMLLGFAGLGFAFRQSRKRSTIGLNAAI
jgi:hypothetical protein